MRRKPVYTLLAICLLVAMPSFAANKPRVYSDATRLAALLNDAQTTISVSSDVWRVVANEANSLANRIYGSTAGSSAARANARNAREHVRMFREAALKGDAAAARSHATEAMTFVTKLIDWSAPATKKT